MPVIEQKTTNKNKVDFDLNRLDKSKTTIFSRYPFFFAEFIYSSALKPRPPPVRPFQRRNNRQYTFFACLCVQFKDSPQHFFLAYVCSPFSFPRQLGFCRPLSQSETSLREIYSIPAAIRGWIGTDTFFYRHFHEDYLCRVRDALSNSQRLLRRARASHRCTRPGAAPES